MLSVELAKLLQQAHDYRTEGMDKTDACLQACRTHGAKDEWSFVLFSMLEFSSTLALEWASERVQNALDRAYNREGDFR
jgi:hypothetical protein